MLNGYRLTDPPYVRVCVFIHVVDGFSYFILVFLMFSSRIKAGIKKLLIRLQILMKILLVLFFIRKYYKK